MSWLFGEISSGTTPDSKYGEFYGGHINWVTTSELRERAIAETTQQLTPSALASYSALKVYAPGTLLIAMYGATIGRLGWLERPACTNQACCAFANPIRVETRFAYYSLSAAHDHLVFLASGGGQPNINQDKLRSLRIAVPSRDEQATIVEFLDRETTKIDEVISKQEQLVATLREDRTATITHAVTKGVDSDVEMQESGGGWLGDVPRGWVASRLKNVIQSTESGTSVNAGDWPAGDGEIGVLKTSCVSAGWFNPTANKTVVDQIEIDRVTCPVRAGSLIVNRANTPLLVGSAGYAAHSHDNLFLSDKLWQVQFDGALAQFIYYWTQTEIYRSQIAALCVGASSSMQNLAMADFRNIALALPPVEEQVTIVRLLLDRTAKIDNLINKSMDVIGVLREYRSAMITDAVTGKIDVRGAA
ncbi:restriction endonuclease subunit S [Mycobacterium malmoense]|uniref:restriction endonuclease subunit S n=1 Tax=Mycobacterium malmoense TaxID=1780 RepID=UPI0009F687FA|nr:restriction endonuclease subunit S [Mycobacterium malmoense]